MKKNQKKKKKKKQCSSESQSSSAALLSDRSRDVCEDVVLSVFLEGSGSGTSLCYTGEEKLCRVSPHQAAGEDLVDTRVAAGKVEFCLLQ